MTYVINLSQYPVRFLMRFNMCAKGYYFTRNYSNPDAPPDQSAFALGGGLNLETVEFWNWFRVDANLFTSQSLGLKVIILNKSIILYLVLMSHH